MEAKLRISKVILFECVKSKDPETGEYIQNANIVGNKVFDFSEKQYADLKSTLEINIKRKLQGAYSKVLSKCDKDDVMVEVL